MSSSVPPAFPSPDRVPLPPGKKPNILLWIIGGVVVLMIGVTAMCGLGGYFLMRKAKDAGFSTSLMTKNPAYPAAKMAMTMNPAIETVSSDDSTGTITIREKNTGKTTTLKFDPDKKTMVIVDENGQQASVKVSGDGDKGTVEVQGADGANLKFGAAAGNQLPSWIPLYPGSSPEGNFSAQTKDGNQTTFSFKTKDAPAKVISYYQDQLKGGGFTINMTTTSPQGGMLMAEDGAKTRTVMLTVSGSGDGTDVSVSSSEKKGK